MTDVQKSWNRSTLPCSAERKEDNNMDGLCMAMGLSSARPMGVQIEVNLVSKFSQFGLCRGV